MRSDQRDRIRRAMVELVAGGGRRAATVRRLTRLAGVSTATFYSLFDGTDECLVATYASLMDEVRDTVAAPRPPAASHGCGEPVLRSLLEGLLGDPTVGRLMLVEVFGAGPAAITVIRNEETRLEAAVRESLERRGRQTSAEAVAWVVAGLLHCARRLLGAVPDRIPAETTGALLGWAESRLATGGPEPEWGPGTGEGAGPAGGRGRDTDRQASPSVRRPPREEETDLFVRAVLRLACTDGYWKLTVPRASRAAGIPATHFKRHFSGLDDAYLLAVDRTARNLFAGFGARAHNRAGAWRGAAAEQIAGLSTSLASVPQLAAVVFTDILAPGADGLTRRETLIDDLAATWRRTVPAPERPSVLVARASMAALWGAVARAADGGRVERLPAQVPTNAWFFAAPAAPGAEPEVKVERAAVAVGA